MGNFSSKHSFGLSHVSVFSKVKLRIALYNTLKVCSKYGLLACGKKKFTSRFQKLFKQDAFPGRALAAVLWPHCLLTSSALLGIQWVMLGQKEEALERAVLSAWCWHHPSWRRLHLISLLKEMCWTPLIIHQTIVLLFCPWKTESLRLQFTYF